MKQGNFQHRRQLWTVKDTPVSRGIAILSGMMLLGAAFASASCKQRSFNNAVAKSNGNTSPSSEIQIRTAEFESLANLAWNRLQTLSGGISYTNPPLPPDAKRPDAGATNTYDRGATRFARVSTMDIEIFAYDDSGTPVHAAHEGALKQMYKEIWGWKKVDWEKALKSLSEEERNKILRTKSGMFWEHLAQQLAERVFGHHNTLEQFSRGPRCALKPCEPEAGIPEVSLIVVKTSLDGARDPINAVTRSLFTAFRRDALKKPAVVLQLEVPAELRVGSDLNEFLDFRPLIGKQRPESVVVQARASMKEDKTQSGDYPDYNLIFTPLRHLLLQGEVTNPRTPSTSKEYPNREAFVQSARELLKSMEEPAEANVVASSLEPFFTNTYYYPFGSMEQIKSYRDYILGKEGSDGGVRAGYLKHFSEVRLLLNGAVVIGDESPN